MIVERNDGSIIEGEIIIQLFAINCEMMQGLKWILAKVEHWNWLLKKSNELMLRQSIIKNMKRNH